MSTTSTASTSDYEWVMPDSEYNYLCLDGVVQSCTKPTEGTVPYVRGQTKVSFIHKMYGYKPGDTITDEELLQRSAFTPPGFTGHSKGEGELNNQRFATWDQCNTFMTNFIRFDCLDYIQNVKTGERTPFMSESDYMKNQKPKPKPKH